MAFDPNKYLLCNCVTLRDFQKKYLEILLYFRDFCYEHNLTFWLCGGSCIGAMRHKGFIPWDCDIDVFMPRSEYERIGMLWNKFVDTSRYSYERTTMNYNIHAQCSGIKDNNTTHIREHNINSDINHGIMLDIIPLDVSPDLWTSRMLQKFWGPVFCLFNSQRVPNQQSKIVRIISKIILTLIPWKTIRYYIWKYAESQICKYNSGKYNYYAEYTTGFSTLNIRYPRDIFDGESIVMFEGHKMPVPKEVDKYLTIRYGKYMKYPPKSEQIPKFSGVYVNLNESYKKFKHKYYCNKEG